MHPVDPPAPIGSRAQALSQAPPPGQGQAGRGRRREGVLVKVTSQEDRHLAEGGRGLKGSEEEGGAVSSSRSGAISGGVDDKGVERVITEELEASGPRAQAF